MVAGDEATKDGQEEDPEEEQEGAEEEGDDAELLAELAEEKERAEKEQVCKIPSPGSGFIGCCVELGGKLSFRV